MREIKFRAWDNEFKTMVYEFTNDGYSIDMQNGSLVVGSNDGNGDYFELPIMQYTGLKDKNGKEIYEEDILKISDDFDNKKIFALEYKNGAFVVEWDGMFYEDADMTTLGWAMDEDYEIEILGNIYENPELLN